MNIKTIIYDGKKSIFIIYEEQTTFTACKVKQSFLITVLLLRTLNNICNGIYL